MLMALVVVTLLTTSFATIVTAMIQHSTEISGESVSQTQARASIDELARDLRQAYVGDTTNGIESITSTSITFDSPDRATPFHLAPDLVPADRREAPAAADDLDEHQRPALDLGHGRSLGDPRRLGHERNHLHGLLGLCRGTTTTTASAVRAVTFGVNVSNPGSHGRPTPMAAAPRCGARHEPLEGHVRRRGGPGDDAGRLPRRHGHRAQRDHDRHRHGESTRSAHAVVSGSSFEAAEPVIDDYTAELLDDHLYYLHYVQAAESTRRTTGGVDVAAGMPGAAG